MAATPKPDRKNIKSAKRTIEKSKIFPKEKMHDIAKKTARYKGNRSLLLPYFLDKK